MNAEDTKKLLIKELGEEKGEVQFRKYFEPVTAYLAIGAPDAAMDFSGEIPLVHPKTGYVYLADRTEYFIWTMCRTKILTEEEIYNLVFKHQGKYDLDVSHTMQCLEQLVEAKVVLRYQMYGESYAKFWLLNLCRFTSIDLNFKDKLHLLSMSIKQNSLGKMARKTLPKAFSKLELTEDERKVYEHYQKPDEQNYSDIQDFFYNNDKTTDVEKTVEIFESLLQKGAIYISDAAESLKRQF